MNEFFRWILKHSTPWDIQPPLSDAELDELFGLMSKAPWAWRWPMAT